MSFKTDMGSFNFYKRFFALLGLLLLSTPPLCNAEQSRKFSDAIDSLLNVKGLFPKTLQPEGRFTSNDNNLVEALKASLNNDETLLEFYQNFQKVFLKSNGHQKINDPKREKLFQQEVIRVAEHNKAARKGLISYKKGVNQFSDITREEIAQKYKGYKSQNLEDIINEGRKLSGPPQSLSYDEGNCDKTVGSWLEGDIVNWDCQQHGVSSVKDQGNCGSCTMFAAAAAFESVHFLKYGGLIMNVSEQELLDCAMEFSGYSGCEGNNLENPLLYMQKYGLCSEEDYPREYKAKVGPECFSNKCTHSAPLDEIWFVEPIEDEVALTNAVKNYGPILVAISAEDNFVQYKKGIYEDACKGKVNHAVVVTGYGTNSNGTDYWIVKNSWSTTWGDEGFIRMRRNHKNMCYIASYGIALAA